MRIGVLRDDTIVNSLYRTEIPMRALEAMGHDVRWRCKTASGYDIRQLETCDVVHIHRLFDREAQRLAQHLRGRGIAIWWDNDDDLTAAPRGTEAYRQLGGSRAERVAGELRRMMRAADLVSTPSRVLADRLSNGGARAVEVLENHLPDSFADARRRRQDDDIVIGWIAASEHRIDVGSLHLQEMLAELTERNPSVEVMTVGVRLGLRSRYRHVRGVQLSDLAETAAQFDIGIAPLSDIPMNQARSNVKLKEYAAAGVAWLASPVGPYIGFGERQGGRLVADDVWLHELERLVRDRRARLKLSKRAAKWGRSETIGRNVKAWSAALHHAAEVARSRCATG